MPLGRYSAYCCLGFHSPYLINENFKSCEAGISCLKVGEVYNDFLIANRNLNILLSSKNSEKI